MTPYFQNDHGQLFNCDVLDGIKSLPDNSVDLIVTSPPYWGLRDYGVDGQIGLETDFQTFLCKLVEIFNECHRILKPSGNLYVNMGDSYAGSGKGTWAVTDRQKNTYVPAPGGKQLKCKSPLPAKNLIGQSWRLAFALQDSGWILREDIIWAKGNPMPESVIDRCTRSHEYIFHFTKSPKYYYDAYSIREAYAYKTFTTWGNQKSTSADGSGLVKAENFAGLVHAPKDWSRFANKKPSGWATGKDDESLSTAREENAYKRKDKQSGHSCEHSGFNERRDSISLSEQYSMGANKRSVWTVGTKPFKGAHFATFPPDLIAPIIQAACPLGGTVLDIFGGSGTTACVAEQFQRKWLLFELNPKYCDIAVKRIQGVAIEEPTDKPELTIEDFIEVQG